MALTWKDLFFFIKEMWDLNQNDIAVYLDCRSSTISRLISGNIKRSRLKTNELYEKLFDPTKERCPAFGQDKRTLLNDLVKTIEDAGFKEEIKALKHDDYESFAKGLLRLVNKKDQPEKTSPHKERSYLPQKNRVKESLQAEPEAEKMYDIFREAAHGFAVSSFIESDPMDSIKDHFISEDVMQFANRILYNHKREDILDRDEEIYQTIIKFTNVLLEYHEYLKQQMIPIRKDFNYRWCYEHPKDDNEEFRTRVQEYREQLKSLYNEILPAPE